MAELRKRPELSGVFTVALPAVPQLFVNVDRDKVLKQSLDISDVYKTVQAFMGGTFINFFNRFGRTWQVYVQAEGSYRTQAENVGRFYVRNTSGQMVPLSTVVSLEPRLGPEYTMHYNMYQAAQINGSAATGYSSAQAMKVLEEVFAQTHAAGNGLRLHGHVLSGAESADKVCRLLSSSDYRSCSFF